MPKLKTIYEKAEEIPEGYSELYVERNGKFELTGIEGVKTQTDLDKLNEALRKERADHKASKDALAKWGDLNPDEIPAQLEELNEVKAQLATATKDGKINEGAVQERIEAAVTRAVGPLQRDKASLEKQLAAKDAAIKEKASEVENLHGTIKRNRLEGILRDTAIAAKILPTAIDDAVMVGINHFEQLEDGRIVTKDGVGLTPGLDPKEWAKDMQERRPHWWPPSVGGGARGGGAPLGRNAENPWSAEGWNVTKQGQYHRQFGEAKAAEAAKSVGSFIGATKPPAKAA